MKITEFAMVRIMSFFGWFLYLFFLIITKTTKEIKKRLPQYTYKKTFSIRRHLDVDDHSKLPGKNVINKQKYKLFKKYTLQ